MLEGRGGGQPEGQPRGEARGEELQLGRVEAELHEGRVVQRGGPLGQRAATQRVDSVAHQRERVGLAEGSRRIGNALIKSELGVELRYPTFREGLESLMPSGSSPSR